MSSAYWACALLEAKRERVALRFWAAARPRGPMLGTKRNPVPLFPGYCFILIAERGWWTARWSIGVRNLVGKPGGEPARVPDRIIVDLRSRERNGLIVLKPKPGLQRDDQVRITRDPLQHRLAIYEGMKGRERVEVLLTMLVARFNQFERI